MASRRFFSYLDALVDALVVRRLLPWHENLKKRQVKAPKPYIADTGLLHALDSEAVLLGHPKAGASWEGFAMQETVRILGVDWDRCYCWATYQGAELDLLVLAGGRRLGFEFKRTSAPRLTRSTRSAMADGARPLVHGVSGQLPVPSGSKRGGRRTCVRVLRGAVGRRLPVHAGSWRDGLRWHRLGGTLRADGL